MIYLISEIRLYLVIGVGLGILIGWIFRRSEKIKDLEKSNLALEKTIDRMKAKLKSCEQSVQPGVEQ